jgi:hypothetical protein
MDPLTIAALIKAGTSLASGISASASAKGQAADEATRAQDAINQAKQLSGEAKAARGQYGLGPSYSELRQLVMQDPTSDYLRQQAQRQEAGQMEALQAGGARALLGGTQAVAQGSMDRMAQIAAEEQQRRARGLEAVGTAEQRVAEQKLSDARTDLALGRGLEAEGLAQKYGAEDLARSGRQAMLQAGIQAAGGIATGAAAGAGKFDGVDPELLKMFMEDGGLVRGKTPGEFSHDENPIDIMQDGQKIGEMTGGEGVVSPEDLGKLEQLAGEGKTPLHKFVKGLIKKLENNGRG